MTEKHIVKAFDDDLAQLSRLVMEMGGLVEIQLLASLEALVSHDPEAAKEVISHDKLVDECEVRIDKHTMEMLALRSPMAEDLRIIVATLKIAANFERMGDYSKNIAKRTITLTKVPLLSPSVQSIKRMGLIVQEMIDGVLRAYTSRDSDLALAVVGRDQDVDRLNTSLFREFLELMTDDPRQITAGTHLIFIAKDVERMGDHVTNVAEKVYYMLEGMHPEGKRPKADHSAKIVVDEIALGGKGSSNE